MALAACDSEIAFATPPRAIDDRLSEIVRMRGPLRRALAAVAARLVEARGWERLGFARLSDYARERTGLSARQLHDLTRTHERLRELPCVERALLDGTLTWTRARLVARAATSADEEVWVARARGLSTSALEREVRAVDRGALERRDGESVDRVSVDEDGLVEEVRENVQIRCTASVRGKWNHVQTLARQVAGERLAPWQCAEAIAAEVLSALPVREDLGPLRFEAVSAPARPGAIRDERDVVNPERAADVGGCGGPQGPVEPSSETTAPVPEDDGCATPPWRHATCPEPPMANGPARWPPDRVVEFGRGTFALRTRARWRARQDSMAPHASAAGTNAVAPGMTVSSAAVASRAAAVPVLVQPLALGLDAADAFELDRRLRDAVALEQRLDAKIGSLLMEVAGRHLHRSWGFSRLDAFVRERLGLSPRKARMLLRLERAARRCPALGEAYRDARISWVRAHALVPIVIAAPNRASHWIAWAQRVTVRRLEEDVRRALGQAESAPEAFAATGGLPPETRSGELPGARAPATRGDAPIVPGRDGSAESAYGGRSASDPLSPKRQTRARHKASDRPPHEPCRFFFNAPRDVARLVRSTLCTVRRFLERSTGRLPTEGEAMEAMLDHVFAAWDPEDRERPRAHRVFERDGWRCTAPACSSYRNLHDHHITFRSAGGSDALDNRTTLCAWHHLRGVHAGIVGCRGRAPDGLLFELGLRRRRRPLLACRSGDVLIQAAAAEGFARGDEARRAGSSGPGTLGLHPAGARTEWVS
jgi:hypothetical protein